MMTMRIVEWTQSTSRREFLLYLIPHIVLVFYQILFFDLRVDDAYITYHYSQNLVETGQLVWNIGEAPIEGYSTILLILIQAPAAAIGVDLNIFMRVVGVLCGHLTLIGIALASRATFPDAGHYYLPGLFLASMTALAVHSLSGMETALYILIISILLFFLAQPKRNHLAVSTLLISISLVRLEGVLIAGVIMGFDLLRAIWKRDKTVVITISTLVSIGAYHLFRIMYFGSLFSLPTFAKRINLFLGVFDLNGVTESFEFLFRFSPFFMLAIISLIYIARLEDVHICLILMTLSLFLVTWLFSPIMGFEFRFLFPVMIPVLILAHKFTARFVGSLSELQIQNLKTEKEILQRIWKFRYLVPVLFLLMYPTLRSPNVYDRMIGYSKGLDSNFELSEWLMENSTEGDIVALWDVGIVSCMTNLVILDLGGLNDRVLASGWNTSYVFMRAPKYIVLHSLTEEEYIPWVDGELMLYESEEFLNYELVKVFPIVHRSHAYMLYIRV